MYQEDLSEGLKIQFIRWLKFFLFCHLECIILFYSLVVRSYLDSWQDILTHKCLEAEESPSYYILLARESFTEARLSGALTVTASAGLRHEEQSWRPAWNTGWVWKVIAHGQCLGSYSCCFANLFHRSSYSVRAPWQFNQNHLWHLS